MSFGATLAAVILITACGVGVGFVRRGRALIGAALIAISTCAVVVMAALGNLRPLVGLVGITAFLTGIAVDKPGVPVRRALGLLAFSAGFIALGIARFYT